MADDDLSALLVLDAGHVMPDDTTMEDFAVSVWPWLSWLNCEVDTGTGTEGISLGLFIADCPDDERADYERAIDAVFEAVMDTETDDVDPEIPRSVIDFMARVGLAPFPDDMGFTVREDA